MGSLIIVLAHERLKLRHLRQQVRRDCSVAAPLLACTCAWAKLSYVLRFCYVFQCFCNDSCGSAMSSPWFVTFRDGFLMLSCCLAMIPLVLLMCGETIQYPWYTRRHFQKWVGFPMVLQAHSTSKMYSKICSCRLCLQHIPKCCLHAIFKQVWAIRGQVLDNFKQYWNTSGRTFRQPWDTC